MNKLSAFAIGIFFSIAFLCSNAHAAFTFPLKNWNGLYVKASIGASKTTFSPVDLSGIPSNSGVDFPGVSGKFDNQKIPKEINKFALGYEHLLGNFYLGGDLFFEINMNVDKDQILRQANATATTYIRQKIFPSAFSFGAELQPGFLITNKLLAFVDLGFIASPVKLDFYTSLMNDPIDHENAIHKSFLSKGLQYGAGLRYAINKHFSLSTEFIETHYLNKSIILSHSTSVSGGSFISSSSTKIKNSSAILLVIFYRF